MLADADLFGLDYAEIEDTAKELYIRALKILPPQVKRGFDRLARDEDDATAQTILGTMIENIRVAERTRQPALPGHRHPDLQRRPSAATCGSTASRSKGRSAAASSARRASTRLRSSVVHPITRVNEQSSCGRLIPVINIDFDDAPRQVRIEMIPKGSGSENGSFLKMLIPADGVDGIKTYVVDRIMEVGGRVCPPTIVGVGIGGTSDLCMHLAKVAATRPLGSACADPEGEKLEKMLSIAVNSLGIGPQGLGGRGTAFAVHVETAATHITMNPVAVNIQCHSARRASAVISAEGVEYGF